MSLWTPPPPSPSCSYTTRGPVAVTSRSRLGASCGGGVVSYGAVWCGNVWGVVSYCPAVCGVVLCDAKHCPKVSCGVLWSSVVQLAAVPRCKDLSRCFEPRSMARVRKCGATTYPLFMWRGKAWCGVYETWVKSFLSDFLGRICRSTCHFWNNRENPPFFPRPKI